MRLHHTGALPAALILIAGAVTVVSAETIYVAPKDSEDYAVAQEKGGELAQRTLHKALAQAAELLNQPGAREVTVLVAQGQYDGKAGQGIWEIPTIKNREGTLRLLGGYSDGFQSRDPFDTMTELVTSPVRNGAFLSLGQRSELSEYVISGFIMDGSVSNSYDRDSNSFQRGKSRTWPIVSFGYLRTDHLVVADNVFINAGHGVFDPAVTPLSPNAVVDIQNNFFVNNIKPLQIGAGISPVKEVRFRYNTVLQNWPYNPDTTSANVGAVTLHNSESAQHLLIEGNLFAHNVGGAMQHDWPEERMPEVTLANNLFYNNASLFGEEDPGGGVLVGKFGLNPLYLVLDLDTVEEDFDYTVGGNVVLDPGFEIDMDLSVEEDGDDVELSGFAPKVPLQILLPTSEEAAKYGVQPASPYAP